MKKYYLKDDTVLWRFYVMTSNGTSGKIWEQKAELTSADIISSNVIKKWWDIAEANIKFTQKGYLKIKQYVDNNSFRNAFFIRCFSSFQTQSETTPKFNVEEPFFVKSFKKTYNGNFTYEVSCYDFLGILNKKRTTTNVKDVSVIVDSDNPYHYVEEYNTDKIEYIDEQIDDIILDILNYNIGSENYGLPSERTKCNKSRSSSSLDPNRMIWGLNSFYVDYSISYLFSIVVEEETILEFLKNLKDSYNSFINEVEVFYKPTCYTIEAVSGDDSSFKLNVSFYNQKTREVNSTDTYDLISYSINKSNENEYNSVLVKADDNVQRWEIKYDNIDFTSFELTESYSCEDEPTEWGQQLSTNLKTKADQVFYSNRYLNEITLEIQLNYKYFDEITVGDFIQINSLNETNELNGKYIITEMEEIIEGNIASYSLPNLKKIE